MADDPGTGSITGHKGVYRDQSGGITSGFRQPAGIVGEGKWKSLVSVYTQISAILSGKADFWESAAVIPIAAN